MSANKRYEPWTPEQTNYLRQLYATHSIAQLATLVGRNEKSVKSKVESLGLAKRTVIHRPWTAADDAMLKRIYHQSKIDQVASTMNRSRSAITHRATFLKITRQKRPPSYRPWTAAEDATLMQIYNPREIDRVMELMNRSRSSLTHRAAFLKIPGRAARLPIGATRMDTTKGLAQVKVSAKKGGRGRNYKWLYVLEWEAVNGPLPEGMSLMRRNPFLDRTPDNLILVPTDTRLLHQNAVSTSPEVQELLRIQRQINREFHELSKRTEKSQA